MICVSFKKILAFLNQHLYANHKNIKLHENYILNFTHLMVSSTLSDKKRIVQLSNLNKNENKYFFMRLRLKTSDTLYATYKFWFNWRLHVLIFLLYN